jgi:hypothetical protein
MLRLTIPSEAQIMAARWELQKTALMLCSYEVATAHFLFA